MKFRAVRWLPTVLAGIVVGASVYLFWLAPTIEGIFNNVSDDWCQRASSGEPVRTDPDCQSDTWSGVNHIEEWDRLHPSP